MSLHQQALQALLGGMKPVASHPPEDQFQAWMAERDIDPREMEVYDFRKAMMSGAERDETGHWPSDFKYDFTDVPNMTASDKRTHPNIVVGGFHTQTGKRVPGAKLASGVQELIELGWEPEAAKQLWAKVAK